MKIKNEQEGYALLMQIHLEELIERLRQIPPDRWDWQVSPPAPSARLTAEHALAWLQADRQHLEEPDITRHRHTPAPPAGQQALCDALEEEAKQWQTLLARMTPEQWDASYKQFGMQPCNGRFFVCHILQNTIYKHGQLSTLYFALGMDGSEPFRAPLPNDVYAEVDDILARPLHAAVFLNDLPRLESLLRSDADINAPDTRGVTPLIAAARLGKLEVLRLLLAHGAQVELQDSEGHTALFYAEAIGHKEAADLLRR